MKILYIQKSQRDVTSACVLYMMISQYINTTCLLEVVCIYIRRGRLYVSGQSDDLALLKFYFYSFN